ncbi:MAG: hypothetical protein AAGN82_21495 [Myxococcota bacterium]
MNLSKEELRRHDAQPEGTDADEVALFVGHDRVGSRSDRQLGEHVVAGVAGDGAP